MAQISESVTLEKQGRIGILLIDNPPVNALSWHVRDGLADGIKAASGDDEIEAIVLACKGRTFIAGADIREFGQPPKGAGLRDVQNNMEFSEKPVVAAIHGTALGGGLEVAMCAHYRIGDAKARYGQPEVKIGLLPGAGGTQRIPRLVGIAKGLEMCAIGDPIGSAAALECGLIDEIADGDLVAAAVAFADRALDEALPLKRIRDLNDKLEEARANPGIFDEFRRKIARKTRNFLAPEYNIQCIEAAVELPFDEGLKREGELFQKLVTGDQSAAQRYYFFAEREAAKVPDVPKDTPLRPIETVGVLGCGTMGGGISMNFANRGIPVTIVEAEQERLDRGMAVIRKNYERSVSSGRISMEDVDRRMSLLTGSLDKNDFADKDIVIEAVFEDMELKKSVFRELDSICRDGTILASNTSALDVNQIAAETRRPEDVIGLHFFSPANVMRLLEVVRGSKTADDVIATSMSMAKNITKIPVLVGVCHGFVGNRILFQRGIEANKMILEGATPWQVDQVLYDFGFPMGPFAMSDLAGLDIGWKKETSSSSTIRELLCERGRLGQKSGSGYYVYNPENRASSPDPEVEEIIREFANGQGIEQHEVTDQEILERCLYPMVNEGARILEEGIAIRASDIDVVWVNGYGWPVYRGGPMFWAGLVGLGEVAAKINHYSETLGGDHWQISPLLQQLADDGKKFS
ncbi:MAG: 3-hydroxyacyl-CoA dehydrogenase NAD-binding domain-containing protein [Acidobacteriota bacterium]|nr:3-hydroxyacyl-CoA dehydrogenase NAD-binding domain-containing protein [Acidobacteriota bacterium]